CGTSIPSGASWRYIKVWLTTAWSWPCARMRSSPCSARHRSTASTAPGLAAAALILPTISSTARASITTTSRSPPVLPSFDMGDSLSWCGGAVRARPPEEPRHSSRHVALDEVVREGHLHERHEDRHRRLEPDAHDEV